MPLCGQQCTGFNWFRIAMGSGLILISFASTHAVQAKDSTTHAPPTPVDAQRLARLPPVAPPRGVAIAVDHSGRKEAGTASIYADFFDGRTMANGRRYNPHANVAASKSLPLGTIAKVINLETGKSTEVVIADRGPFVAGRVVDLTPQAAAAIGLTSAEGLAPVMVAPVAVPQPDGTLKPGAGAAMTDGDLWLTEMR